MSAPRWPAPDPVALMRAPELAVLAALDATLRSAERALCAANPELLGDGPAPGARVPRQVRVAERLIASGAAVLAALAHYAAAVEAEQANIDDRDIPF